MGGTAQSEGVLVTAPLRELFDAAPVGMALVSAPSARVVLCNQRFATLVERDVADLRSADLSTLVPGFSAALISLVDEVKTEGGSKARELHGRPWHEDRVRWWRVVVQALSGGDASHLHLSVSIEDITAQKMDEQRVFELNQALRRQVSEFETLLQVIPVGISISHDPHCRKITNNRYLSELLALQDGQNASIDPAASDRAATYRVFRDGGALDVSELPMHRALRTQSVVCDTEFDVVVQGQRHLTLTGNAAPLLDEEGRPRGAIAAFSDISGRKRVENELRDSERRFRSLAETIPQIVFTGSPSGWIDYFNPRWSEYTGRPVEQSLGMAWQDAIDPQDLARWQADWHAALSSASRLETEVRLRNRSGASRWHMVRANALCNADGRVTMWVGTCADIDQAKRAERRSRLLDGMTQVLTASLDVDLTLDAISDLALPALADLVVLEVRASDDHVRRTVTSCEGPTRKHLAEALVQALSCSDPQGLMALTGGKVCRTNDFVYEPEPCASVQLGEVLRGLAISSLISVPLVVRGRTLGALTFLYASSGRRYAHEDEELCQELASRAALAVDNALLYGEARSANSAKDRFLAAVSHDLRSPLMAITTAASLLRMGPLSDRAERAAKLIERNAWRQARLVDDLLDVSRMSAGTFRIQKQIVDLGGVIEGAVQSLLPIAAAQHLSLVVERDPALGSLNVDAQRLVQVLDNLITNGIKFTPRGGRVVISAHRGEDCVVIKVADTGRGIDSKFLSHAFEPFVQSTSSDDARKGLGLGLAIARQIVEQHGGTISAFSAGAGQGTTFTVTFPIAEEVAK